MTARWIRWLAVTPVALTAAAVVQIGSAAVFRSALALVFGYPDWLSPASGSLAAALMGAVLVLTAWWLVPGAKLRIAALALVALAVWAGRLTLLALIGDGSLWSSGIGLSGVAGGVAAFGWLRSRDSFRF